MARKTKAEIAAEEKVSKETFEREFMESLLKQTLTLIAKAHRLHIDVKVKIEEPSNLMSVTFRNNSTKEEIVLTLTEYFSKKLMWDFREAEFMFHEEENRINEANRLYELRKTALDKLTEEEKRLLGLK